MLTLHRIPRMLFWMLQMKYYPRGTFLVPNGILQVRKFTAGKAQERIQFKSIHANHVFLSHHDNYNNS